MEIKDLQPRMGNVELVATVADKGDVRTFEKFGKSGRVCSVTVKDASGQVVLTLWNADCDKFNVGDKIKLSNGYVGEFRGEMQLSAGKFGSLELVEKAENESPEGSSTDSVKADDVEEEVVK